MSVAMLMSDADLSFYAVAIAIAMIVALAGVLWAEWEKTKHQQRSGKSGYTPRGDRVIVKRLPQPKPKEGELLIPGSQRKPLDEGIVIAVGPEIEDIEPGNHVCFLEFAGTTVEIDGESYLSMRDQEIHGIRKVSNA